MNKKELRQAMQDGLKVYLSSGKTITKCQPVTAISIKRKHKPKQEVSVDTSLLPASLKIRFGWME